MIGRTDLRSYKNREVALRGVCAESSCAFKSRSSADGFFFEFFLVVGSIFSVTSLCSCFRIFFELLRFCASTSLTFGYSGVYFTSRVCFFGFGTLGFVCRFLEFGFADRFYVSVFGSTRLLVNFALGQDRKYSALRRDCSLEPRRYIALRIFRRSSSAVSRFVLIVCSLSALKSLPLPSLSGRFVVLHLLNIVRLPDWQSFLSNLQLIWSILHKFVSRLLFRARYPFR